MRVGSWMRQSLASVCAIGLLPLTVLAYPDAPSAPIDPALLDVLASGGTANFFVKMSVQADLGVAYNMGWAARGEYVWRVLNQVAGEAQALVVRYAQDRGLEVRSFVSADAVYVREGDLRAARDLAALPGVAGLILERSHPLAEPMEGRAPAAVVAWGLEDIGAPEVWAAGYRGEGITLATIDTGVQWDHPALVGGYPCADDPGNPRCWYDPSNVCGGAPCDNNGHGTHVTGILVARDDPAFPYVAGVAPDASWIACKGCEASWCSDFALMACADWLLAPGGEPANRPHAVNNSWGGAGGDPWFRGYVLAWRAAGIFAGAAAGGGAQCNTLGSPCDYQEMFCTTAHDEDRNPLPFASRGPSYFGHDPYTKPNISAPGANICSTVPTNGWECGYSGTSFASPHSVGSVGLVYSACPDLIGQLDATFELLQSTADPPPIGNCGAPPDGEGNYTSGYGYLNVEAAVAECSRELAHVGGVWLRYREAARQYLVSAFVLIQDGGGVLIPDAAVSLEWRLPDGSMPSQQATTNGQGIARFRARGPQGGAYRVCVLEVVAPGYGYDSFSNVETCDTLLVP